MIFSDFPSDFIQIKSLPKLMRGNEGATLIKVHRSKVHQAKCALFNVAPLFRGIRQVFRNAPKKWQTICQNTLEK